MKKILALVLLLTFSVQQTRSCPPCAVVLAYFAGISTETVIVSGLAAGVTTANVVYFVENGPLFQPVTETWNPNETPTPNPGGSWISQDALLQMLVGTAIITRLAKAPTGFKERKEFLQKEYEEDRTFRQQIEQLSKKLIENGFLIIPVATNLGTASKIIVQGYSWNPEYPAFNQYDEVSNTWSYTSFTETGWTTSPISNTGGLKVYEKFIPKGPGTFAWNRGLEYVRNTTNLNVIKSFLAGDCKGDPECEGLQKVKSFFNDDDFSINEDYGFEDDKDMNWFDKKIKELSVFETSELISMLLDEDPESMLAHVIRTILFRRMLAGETIPVKVIFPDGDYDFYFVQLPGQAMEVVFIYHGETFSLENDDNLYFNDQVMTDGPGDARIGVEISGTDYIGQENDYMYNRPDGPLDSDLGTFQDEVFRQLEKIGLKPKQ